MKSLSSFIYLLYQSLIWFPHSYSHYLQYFSGRERCFKGKITLHPYLKPSYLFLYIFVQSPKCLCLRLQKNWLCLPILSHFVSLSPSLCGLQEHQLGFSNLIGPRTLFHYREFAHAISSLWMSLCFRFCLKHFLIRGDALAL